MYYGGAIMHNKLDKILVSNGYGVKRYYLILSMTILAFLYSYVSFLIFGLEKSPSDYYYFFIIFISIIFGMGVFILPISYLNNHFLRVSRYHNVKIVDIFRYFISNAFSKYNSIFYISIFTISSFLISKYTDNLFIEILLVQLIGILIGFVILVMTLVITFKNANIKRQLLFFTCLYAIVISISVSNLNTSLLFLIIIVCAVFVYYFSLKIVTRMEVIDL